MALRVQLQTVLEALCDHVYFQPPASVQMEYPAIVYQRDTIDTRFADDLPYRNLKKYQLTLISRDPDETIVDMVAQLPSCTHERFFVADNLNHDVFTLYF